jgi:hypothetical protein
MIITKSLRGIRKTEVVRVETLEQVKLLLQKSKTPPDDPSGGPRGKTDRAVHGLLLTTSFGFH